MRTFFVILFAAILAGCSGSTPYDNVPTANVSANATTSPKPPDTSDSPTPSVLFTIDPGGPTERMIREGYGDEQIRQNIADIDKSITYALLDKNADKYEGFAWGFTGKILQIFERNGQTKALVEFKPNQNFWLYANFPTDFVKGNRIYAVGYLHGTETYETIAKWQLTIPVLIPRAMIKPQDLAKYKSFKK